MIRASTPLLYAGFIITILSPAAFAQHDPQNGEWGKDDPNDLRIMTWNVEDALCSSNAKTETASGGNGNWHACARIVAAMRPDVLIIQEAGDNSGNGTGSGVDSVANLTTVMNLFINGGTDPFEGGIVTAYVRKYAPDFDLPHIFVSAQSDNFNRNVILSRYPFTDLNGDAKSTYTDIYNVTSIEYAPGGDGGIRGFMFAEIDLPPQYAGDVVVFNAHLKAGGSNSDETQRREAAQNTAYFIDHWYNGGGAGVPDPDSAISDSPIPTMILGPTTPVVFGGDWNEDESSNGQRGPALWLTEAEFDCNSGCAPPTDDGTDRDQTDAVFDTAINPFNGSDGTLGGSKLDHIAWQDSITTDRNSFVFNSSSMPFVDLPPEVQGFPTPSSASFFAADHRPVIVDLIVPLTGAPLGACCDTGICVDGQSVVSCESVGGVYQGDDTVCVDITCPPPSGACCDGEVCTDAIEEANCIGGGGDYQGHNSTCMSASCAAVTINEIRINQTGPETDEYFELAGAPGTALNGLTYIVIGDGSSGTGAIEEIIPLDGLSIPADGVFFAAEGPFTLPGTPDLSLPLNFENSDNVTHLLVSGFTGALDDDLDLDNNGTLDIEPWGSIVDCIGLSENFPIGDQIYCPTIVGPDGSDVPGHVYACPTLDDPWLIGLLTAGIDDTAGLPNPCASGACCTDGGACAVVLQSTCETSGGTFTGPDTDCADDADNDTVPDACDLCAGFDDLADDDDDGVPDDCDPCPQDNPDDPDLDGVCTSDDVCQGFDDNVDDDSDGVPDGCDVCNGFDDTLDADDDTVPDDCDACPGFDDALDADDDDIPDDCDNCPDHANNDQANCDEVGQGDVCEIATGAAEDCNTNTIPDACDIDSGASLDDDMNGVPDECATCATTADCADLDNNTIRDDGCVYWVCDNGACTGTAVVFGDMGGAFGECPVDGTADGNDRFHALNCFGNTDPNGLPGAPYLCEDSPPAAMNVDAGGAFGDCAPDGVCDGNDAFAALAAFGGTSSCSCPLDGGPAPSGPGVVTTVAKARLSVIPRSTTVRPGGVLEVDVMLDTPLDDLRGYQLHLGVDGGKAGGLELIDISVDDPDDGARRGLRSAKRQSAPLADVDTWMAFNVTTRQMVVGTDEPGRAVQPGYLATFTFRVERRAAGTFVIDVLHGDDPAQRTFLFPTAAGERIALSTAAAIVSVER